MWLRISELHHKWTTVGWRRARDSYLPLDGYPNRQVYAYPESFSVTYPMNCSWHFPYIHNIEKGLVSRWSVVNLDAWSQRWQLVRYFGSESELYLYLRVCSYEYVFFSPFVTVMTWSNQLCFFSPPAFLEPIFVAYVGNKVGPKALPTSKYGRVSCP